MANKKTDWADAEIVGAFESLASSNPDRALKLEAEVISYGLRYIGVTLTAASRVVSDMVGEWPVTDLQIRAAQREIRDRKRLPGAPVTALQSLASWFAMLSQPSHGIRRAVIVSEYLQDIAQSTGASNVRLARAAARNWIGDLLTGAPENKDPE